MGQHDGPQAKQHSVTAGTRTDSPGIAEAAADGDGGRRKQRAVAPLPPPLLRGGAGDAPGIAVASSSGTSRMLSYSSMGGSHVGLPTVLKLLMRGLRIKVGCGG